MIYTFEIELTVDGTLTDSQRESFSDWVAEQIDNALPWEEAMVNDIIVSRVNT